MNSKQIISKAVDNSVYIFQPNSPFIQPCASLDGFLLKTLVEAMTSPYFLLRSQGKIRLCFGMLVAIAESLSNPGATIVIGKFFTNVQLFTQNSTSVDEFSNRNQKYTYWLVGFTCFTILTNFFGYAIWVSIGYKVGHIARLKLYEALIQQDSTDFDTIKNLSGLALTHFKDIQDLEAAAGIISYEMLISGTGCIIEIAVAFYFSWAVTLICLVGVPALALIGTFLSNPITRQIDGAKLTLDTISEKVSWIFSALETVKLFQKEKVESMWCFKEFSKLRAQNNKYWVLFQLQQGLCRTIVLLVFMQGFYFGSFMVNKHHLPAGNVISVFWCTLNASALFQTFLGHLVEWNKGKASADRLHKLLIKDKEEELIKTIGLAPGFETEYRGKFEKLGWSFASDDSSGYSRDANKSFSKISQADLNFTPMARGSLAPHGEIKFTDVVFSYPQRDELILTGLSIAIEAGKTTFILGESGSGKSTLASILTKQYPYQAGEVTIGGHDVHLLSQNWIEENVYVCDQNTKLFDISIMDNVKIGSKAPEAVTEKQVEDAIKDACADFVWDLQDQLSYMGISHLSGGQQQRISIARARLNDAPIMIYDEVTSALDASLQAQVFSNLLRYRSGKTNIIFTHDISVVPSDEPVFKIINGRVQRFDEISKAKIQSSPKFFAEDNLQIKALLKREAQGALATGPADTEVKASADSEDGNRILIGTFATSIALFKSLPNKLQFLFGMLFTAIHAGINPAFSFCFSKLIMGILDSGAKRLTLWAMMIMLLSLLDGLSIFCGVLLDLEAEKWLCNLRCTLFDIVVAEGPVLDHANAAYISKLLLSDSEKCAEIVTRYWPGLLSMVILGIAGFVCALTFGWKLTLLGSSLLPVFLVVSFYYKRIAQYWTGLREQFRSGVVKLMMDMTSASGFKTIKAQHLERRFRTIYVDREQDLQKISLKMVCLLGAGYGLLRSFPYALESLILWYGMRLVSKSEYTVSRTMSVFSMLMFTVITLDQLTSSVGSVGVGFEALPRFLQAVKADHKLQAVHPLVTSKLQGSKPGWKSLTFFKVSKSFGDHSTAIDNFTESIGEGETVSIMGPSGSGKSTLGKLLLCLEEPSSGEIIIDGKWDLRNMSIWDVRRNVAMVNQAPLDFFAGTIEENLLYGIDPSEKSKSAKMIDTCIKCGAHDFICKMKDQYDTKMKVGLLSGGQMQRLGIVRALLRDPKVLILDECTASLDSENKAIIKRLIASLKKLRSRIIIVITHQQDVADIADRVIRLDK
nr:Hst6 [Starmerella bombicola]